MPVFDICACIFVIAPSAVSLNLPTSARAWYNSFTKRSCLWIVASVTTFRLASSLASASISDLKACSTFNQSFVSERIKPCSFISKACFLNRKNLTTSGSESGISYLALSGATVRARRRSTIPQSPVSGPLSSIKSPLRIQHRLCKRLLLPRILFLFILQHLIDICSALAFLAQDGCKWHPRYNVQLPRLCLSEGLHRLGLIEDRQHIFFIHFNARSLQ